jgi:hypothetical protein
MVIAGAHVRTSRANPDAADRIDEETGWVSAPAVDAIVSSSMRALALAALALALGACDCGRRTTGGGDGGGTDATAGDGATTDAPLADGGCFVRCGPTAACCNSGEECVFDRCLPACAGSRCGDDTLCCGDDELCIGDACVVPGGPCTDETDCGEMETCEPLVHRCVPIPPDAECRYVPPTGEFEPVVQWDWSLESSLAMPLVVQLTDDDGDGTIGPSDVPDIVAPTYIGGYDNAHLTAFEGDDGDVLWQTTGTAICGAVSPAAGDLDGDGTVELVTLTSRGGCGGGATQTLIAYSHTGALEWEGTATVVTRYGSLAIADLEGDGSPEILGGGSIFGSTGTRRWSQPELNRILGNLAVDAPTIADVDLDGRMEVIASNVAFNDDGTVLWRGGSVVDGFTAIGRIVRTSASAGPEVIAVNQTMFQVLDGATGASLFGPITYESSGILAGPPTLADFDADGRAEVGVAGDNRYVVFDLDLPAPHVRWSVASMDSSTGSVGSTVFDFDADGSAEVIYRDECHLRILSGMDGSVLWYASSTSVTAMEYPVIADVDADGNAEMVVTSNSFSGCTGRSLPFDGATMGVRVYRDVLDNWVPTRAIWNQHTYHIDNVRDDGSIPRVEARSWETHNTYRLQSLLDPSAATLAPDLVVSALDARVDACPVTARLRARVENRGARGVPAGVAVTFYAGDPPDRSAPLGTGTTTRMLLAGAGEWVEVVASDLPLDAMMQLRFYAVVDDDGSGSGSHSECDETNNASLPVSADCRGPG